ncbi:MAG: hypothetical protein Q9P44_06860 [Anaerolineae bacterium]|nr:hypothetical protein [Anaerolineae bacterium]
MQAIEGGDLDGLVTMLADDALLMSDGGTRRGRATRPIYGAVDIAKFVSAFKRLAPPQFTTEIKPINGKSGVVLRLPDNTTYSVLTIQASNGKIQQIHLVGDDEKLKHV